MLQTIARDQKNKLCYYQTVGESPGIVFLGGFMSDMGGTKATYLEKVCQEWGRSYIRFDYFGHGLSSGQLEQGTIGRWLADALFVIDNLTQGPQILVGSSMGAWLMVLAALKRIERIHALVGIAAAPDFIEDFERLSPVQLESLQQAGICYIPSQYSEKPYPITKNLIEEGQKHRILQGAIEVNCPIRLLHGLADKDVAWQKSVRLAECVSSKDVIVTLIKDGDRRLSELSHLALLKTTLQSL